MDFSTAFLSDWDELDDAGRQRVYDAIWEHRRLSSDLALPLRHARTDELRYEGLGRLISTDFGDDPSLPACLRRLAESADDEDLREVLLRRAEFIAAVPDQEGRGESVFDPRLVWHLYRTRNTLDFDDGHVLDLVEYVATKRDSAPTRITRERARRVCALLPQERLDATDWRHWGSLRGFMRHRYELVRRLMESETDASRMEETALGGGDGWLSKFALSRLAGWVAVPEGDQPEFLTFECDRLEGYPRERLGRFLALMVRWGNLDASEAGRLLEAAG